MAVSFLQFMPLVQSHAQTPSPDQSLEPTLPASEESSDAERERAIEISRELSSRQQAIENMQSEQGIYSPALQEAYSDLAAFYNEIEDYPSAVSLLSDALQVARINTGLYSEQQLPVILSLIDSNEKMKQWQEIDDLQQLSYHISSRLFSVGASGYLAAAEQYGSWKLRLLRENLLEMNYRAYSDTASQLSRFYESVISNVEMQPGSDPADLLNIIYGKSEADFTIARSVASTPYTAFEGTENPYINQTRCQNVRNTSGQIVRQCVNVRIENPRYRQSQRYAKQLEMNRHAQSMRHSIERLEGIKSESKLLSSSDRQALEMRIAQMQTDFDQLMQLSRRGRLF